MPKTCTISSLKERTLLAHNSNEEKAHAAMILEWIRCQDPSFDCELKDYLFTDKTIAQG
ncbi:MAG: ferritin family protein [Methylobacter sp.]